MAPRRGNLKTIWEVGRKETRLHFQKALKNSMFRVRVTQKGPQIHMNDASEMNTAEVLKVRLEVLRRQHRDLDDAIHALEETGGRADQFTVRRLKKQKLTLKDRISLIEDQLTPDIIA